jgi:hypothetical protein
MSCVRPPLSLTLGLRWVNGSHIWGSVDMDVDGLRIVQLVAARTPPRLPGTALTRRGLARPLRSR